MYDRPAFSSVPPTYLRAGRGAFLGCSRRIQRPGTFIGRPLAKTTAVDAESKSNSRTARMVLGGGGFLGVGPSEVIVIVAVGWLVLGPKQLLTLSRDIGKIVGEVRRAASDARDTFQDAIEADIAATEVRERATRVEGPALPDQEGPVLETEEELIALAAQRPAPESKFLDQIKRAADPLQKAEADIFDIDTDLDEVQRLEQQLQAAKMRLEAKRAAEETQVQNDLASSPPSTSQETVADSNSKEKREVA